MKVKVGDIVIVRSRFTGKERPALVSYITPRKTIGLQFRRGGYLTRSRRFNELRQELVRRASITEAAEFRGALR